MKTMKLHCLVLSAVAVGLFGIKAHAQSENPIPVGQLAAQTGPTSPVGAVYAKGVADAIRYINEHGGIDGQSISLEIEDYGYESARAAAIYDEWLNTLKPVAIQGWGTADTWLRMQMQFDLWQARKKAGKLKVKRFEEAVHA